MVWDLKVKGEKSENFSEKLEFVVVNLAVLY